jgi:SAM-dependent methyltransferase
MRSLPFPPGSFDAIIAVDTLYFADDDLDGMFAQLRRLLAPGGQILAYYSHAANPELPAEVFPRETLPPDKTPVAEALRHEGFACAAWDFTAADYGHAQRMEATLTELRPMFEAEGMLFLYENRMGEARGVQAAHEAGAAARYLYRAHIAEGTDA